MIRWTLGLLIVVLLILHAHGSMTWEFIDSFENKLYDLRLNLTVPGTLDSRIVILDIDENSLKEIGQWPWPRLVMAQLIDQLFDHYQIDVLGMDVVFAEPDNSSGLKQLELLAQRELSQSLDFLNHLKQLKIQLDYDNLFTQSLQNRRVVLGHVFTENSQTSGQVTSGQLPPPILNAEQTRHYGLHYFAGTGYAANLPQFLDKAMGAGHFNSLPDSDGIIRKAPLLYGYQDNLYEALALATARIALGNPPIQLGFNELGGQPHLEFLKLADRIIPIDNKMQVFVPYKGKRGNFPYISIIEVLRRHTEQKELQDKIVLLGTTAQGLLDLRATPLDKVYPGVEIHANLIAGILDQQFRYHLPYQTSLELFLIIVIGIALIKLATFSPLIATLGNLGLIVGIVSLNMVFWQFYNIIFPLAIFLILTLSLFILNMSYGYFIESRNKRYLNQLFGQYIPPELVDEMNKHLGRKFTMESENREMTVLFSDVRGFTTISEGLEPKELSELMNDYLTPMTAIIHKHRGTIDKYMGDAIMAFWGAPLLNSQHARHAVEAAMEMLTHLTHLQNQFRNRGWPEIKIGISLNTGMMNVGNMGSQFRMAYTVLGDAVNLGSRLESITKQYGVQCIVSETTKSAVGNYVYRELDRVKVKGKDQPVAIFEPVARRENLSKEVFDEIVDYEQALLTYRQQDWSKAQIQFTYLQKKSPDRLLYKLYLERINHFMQYPPGKNWDGVYTFKTK